MSVIQMPLIRPLRPQGGMPLDRSKPARTAKTLRGLVIDGDGALARKAADLQLSSAGFAVRWLHAETMSRANEAARNLKVDFVVIELDTWLCEDLAPLAAELTDHALVVVTGDSSHPERAQAALENEAVDWFLPKGSETVFRRQLGSLLMSSMAMERNARGAVEDSRAVAG